MCLVIIEYSSGFREFVSDTSIDNIECEIKLNNLPQFL